MIGIVERGPGRRPSYESWLAGAAAHHRQHGRPLVSLCYAQSLDGSITLRRGQPTALSGPESSALTHRLRAAHEAILVGVDTVLADDPMLTARLAEGENPQPVVLDSRLRTPTTARLLAGHPKPAWIATSQETDPGKRSALEAAGARLLPLPRSEDGRLSLEALLERLGELEVDSLMVEGGARVITSFLSARLADHVILTIAPVFLGGLNAFSGQPNGEVPGATLPSSLHLRNIGYQRLGDDLIVWGQLG